MYEQELKELGLTDNEIKVYLILLENGILNPTKIAEKAGMHRSYIYDILERLLDRGIINTLLVDNKKHYQPVDPKVLRETFELKLRKLDVILPNLFGLFQSTKEETRVELHRGKRVYKTLIKYLIVNLKAKDIVYTLGINEKVLEGIEPIYIKQYFNIIKEKQVQEKIIIAKGNKKIKQKELIYKELDHKYLDETMIVIHQSKVFIFVLGNPYHLIILDSQAVANTYKKQFELMWDFAE